MLQIIETQLKFLFLSICLSLTPPFLLPPSPVSHTYSHKNEHTE